VTTVPTATATRVSRRRQLPALAIGRAEEGHFTVLAGGVQVFPQPGVQIVTDGNDAVFFLSSVCAVEIGFGKIGEIG
jgi:hypothetical protein